jgi:nucleoside-diphosphate-sugar epimerase
VSDVVSLFIFLFIVYCFTACLFDWQGYGVAKVLAEKEAFKFGEENNLSVVTMLPTLTIGPSLIPTIKTSIALSLSLLTGKTK